MIVKASGIQIQFSLIHLKCGHKFVLFLIFFHFNIQFSLACILDHAFSYWACAAYIFFANVGCFQDNKAVYFRGMFSLQSSPIEWFFQVLKRQTSLHQNPHFSQHKVLWRALLREQLPHQLHTAAVPPQHQYHRAPWRTRSPPEVSTPSLPFMTNPLLARQPTRKSFLLELLVSESSFMGIQGFGCERINSMLVLQRSKVWSLSWSALGRDVRSVCIRPLLPKSPCSPELLLDLQQAHRAPNCSRRGSWLLRAPARLRPTSPCGRNWWVYLP